MGKFDKSATETIIRKTATLLCKYLDAGGFDNHEHYCKVLTASIMNKPYTSKSGEVTNPIPEFNKLYRGSIELVKPYFEDNLVKEPMVFDNEDMIIAVLFVWVSCLCSPEINRGKYSTSIGMLTGNVDEILGSVLSREEVPEDSIFIINCSEDPSRQQVVPLLNGRRLVIFRLMNEGTELFEKRGRSFYLNSRTLMAVQNEKIADSSVDTSYFDKTASLDSMGDIFNSSADCIDL